MTSIWIEEKETAVLQTFVSEIRDSSVGTEYDESAAR